MLALNCVALGCGEADVAKLHVDSIDDYILYSLIGYWPMKLTHVYKISKFMCQHSHTTVGRASCAMCVSVKCMAVELLSEVV